MIESPCINVCKLDQVTGLCAGCLRSIDEIRAWRDASLEQKKAILDAASERRQRQAA
jgi:predicted Fe-S protein YdhL (DUF1289 family)